jgi:hypothetical protein
MANTTAKPIYYDWFVINIDSGIHLSFSSLSLPTSLSFPPFVSYYNSLGSVVQHVKNWTTVPPVDIQYVKYA